MKTLFSLLPIIISMAAMPVLAQSEEIEKLLQERDQLMKQYEYYNSQKSNFWGKQSKKDLMAVIDALKEIIRNDTRLVTAYKNEHIRKTGSIAAENTQLSKQVQSDRNLINEQMYALQEQVRTLETRLKARDRKISELQEELKDEKRSSNRSDQYLYIMGILLAGTTLFSVYAATRMRRRKR